MTLAGANNFSENNDNTVYTINSPQNGQYCAVIPKNTDGEVSMLVDMNMKNDFDALVSNSITKDSLVEKLNQEYSKVKTNYPSGILVVPMTDITALNTAVNSNDKQKIFDETKKIGGITSELYKNLIESGLDKSKINQKIMIIEKTETDNKFVGWLKEQMPNFVDGIKLGDTENKVEDSNPFANINPFTNEPEVKEEVTPQPAPVEAEKTTETPVVPEPQPVEAPVFPAPVETPAVPEPAPIANTIEPPAQPTDVNNTIITPGPLPEQQAPTPAVNNQETGIERKSKGFANLLILLIVLGVVTVISIELGKFLFNTFGAQ